MSTTTLTVKPTVKAAHPPGAEGESQERHDPAPVIRAPEGHGDHGDSPGRCVRRLHPHPALVDTGQLHQDRTQPLRHLRALVRPPVRVLPQHAPDFYRPFARVIGPMVPQHTHLCLRGGHRGHGAVHPCRLRFLPVPLPGQQRPFHGGALRPADPLHGGRHPPLHPLRPGPPGLDHGRDIPTVYGQPRRRLPYAGLHRWGSASGAPWTQHGWTGPARAASLCASLYR